MQSIVTPLQAVVTAPVRQIRIGLLASWLKRANMSTAYAIVGSSVVGGSDLVQGQSSVITSADLFDYMDESTYVMAFDYDRRLDEPKGGVSFAIGDITLDNITRRFTPDYNATIGTAIEPRRPIKASIGMKAGSYRSVQVIVGLTSDRPKENRTNRSVEVPMYDYITFIENSTLASSIYVEERVDLIIEDILITLGFGSSQYVLDVAKNTIAFAWFDKTKSAGRRIRDLCESEGGHFYQDENGILRFENRDHYTTYPHQIVQHNIDPNDIISDEDDSSTRIINRAIVIAKPRKVDAAASVIWTSSEIPLLLAAGETKTLWPAFYDSEAGNAVLPIYNISTPVENTDYEANSASDGSGSDKSSQVSIVVTNFVESAKLEITNNDVSPIYVTILQLRGKAARITQAIQKITEDADSINKYEAQEYVFQNDFIQDATTAQSLADDLVARYKNPTGRRKIRIPGIPHLQLKDLVSAMNPNPINLCLNPSFEGNTNHWSVVTTRTAVATLSQDRSIGVPDGQYTGMAELTTV